MYDYVWNVVQSSFELIFRFLSTAELKPGVTFWDMILVMFIAGGIVSTIFRTFGSSGLASAGSGAIDSYKNKVTANKTKNTQKEKVKL